MTRKEEQRCFIPEDLDDQEDPWNLVSDLCLFNTYNQLLERRKNRL